MKRFFKRWLAQNRKARELRLRDDEQIKYFANYYKGTERAEYYEAKSMRG